MAASKIPLIMQRYDEIVPEDRIRKYYTTFIVKIILILKIYGILYRSSKYFYNKHKEFLELLNITDIPNFGILSYRSLRIEWHLINSSIIDITNPDNDSAAVDSSVEKSCVDTNAQRRRKNGKYTDPESSWVTAPWAMNTAGRCMLQQMLIHYVL